MSGSRRILAWLQLGIVTTPLLVVFFAAAGIHDLVGRLARIGSRGRDQGPAITTEASPRGSAILVPAEVWAHPSVAIGQDDEAAINRR
jgi:hypothetical protein